MLYCDYNVEENIVNLVCEIHIKLCFLSNLIDKLKMVNELSYYRENKSFNN